MKSKRFILNALLVVAILTLLVFSYSYMNQPRFGYALYAVFSGETTYNTYNTIGFIDAIFFYVVGPVSSELIAFVVSYNLNFCCQLQPESTKPSSLSDFGQTRNQSLRNNDNSANCDCVDYRPDRNKRFEV